MRGRFTRRNRRTTVLKGSPGVFMLHPCDSAEAVALWNVTSTADSISLSLWIDLIFLLFSPDYSWICAPDLHSVCCAAQQPQPHPFTLIPCPIPLANRPYHFPWVYHFSLLFSSSALQTAMHILFQTSYLCSWSYQWKDSGDGWSSGIHLSQKNELS